MIRNLRTLRPVFSRQCARRAVGGRTSPDASPRAAPIGWSTSAPTPGEKSRGIYVSHLDTATGALSAPQLAAELRNPSYLAVRPDGGFIYAVSEVNEAEGKPGGLVTAFAVDKASGMLKALNKQSSGGAGPAHITVDKTGTHALVANYGGGSVEVLPIAGNGTLEPPSAVVQHTGIERQPGAAEGAASALGQRGSRQPPCLCADLGTDKIMIYRLGATDGSLKPNEPPFASDGPRCRSHGIWPFTPVDASPT